MGKSTEEWAESFEDHPVATSVKGVVIVIAVMLVLGAGVWGLGVAFSWWKGQGDGYQQKNSAQNWIAAQRAFHQEYNDVQAYGQKITLAKQQLDAFQKAHPQVGNGTPYDPLAQQEGNLQTTLTGLQQQCMNTVAQYNTDAKAYLTEDWRDASLPSQLEPGMCQ